jgi:hypothetical protein
MKHNEQGKGGDPGCAGHVECRSLAWNAKRGGAPRHRRHEDQDVDRECAVTCRQFPFAVPEPRVPQRRGVLSLFCPHFPVINSGNKATRKPVSGDWIK